MAGKSLSETGYYQYSIGGSQIAYAERLLGQKIKAVPFLQMVDLHSQSQFQFTDDEYACHFEMSAQRLCSRITSRRKRLPLCIQTTVQLVLRKTFTHKATRTGYTRLLQISGAINRRIHVLQITGKELRQCHRNTAQQTRKRID